MLDGSYDSPAPPDRWKMDQSTQRARVWLREHQAGSAGPALNLDLPLRSTDFRKCTRLFWAQMSSLVAWATLYFSSLGRIKQVGCQIIAESLAHSKCSISNCSDAALPGPYPLPCQLKWTCSLDVRKELGFVFCVGYLKSYFICQMLFSIVHLSC